VARISIAGFSAAALAARWGAPQCGYFRQLPSTLDAVHDLAEQDAPAGTVVLAEEQTAGRGRDGRTWRSPPGGVWLALLLRPAQAELAVLSIRAGLVVADVVDELLKRPVAQLKWPNDVVLGSRKVAGILCEGRWSGETLQWLALGIGINVANPIPPELAERAVALAELAPEVQRLHVLDALIPALLRLTPQSVRLSESELSAFAARDWLRGRQLRKPLYGRASGLRPDGALLVDTGPATAGVREGHVELA
jgi:BirA family biotin operon repressor/biotin-[acetyl-CoA-carboxylase] ligase